MSLLPSFPSSRKTVWPPRELVGPWASNVHLLSSAVSIYVRKMRGVPPWASMLRKIESKGVSFTYFKVRRMQYSSGRIPAGRNREVLGVNPIMEVLMRIHSPKGVRG